MENCRIGSYAIINTILNELLRIPSMNYKLSPSDLTFSYEGCKRCFYRKVVNGIPQPSIPLPFVYPGIKCIKLTNFDKVDNRMWKLYLMYQVY